MNFKDILYNQTYFFIASIIILAVLIIDILEIFEFGYFGIVLVGFYGFWLIKLVTTFFFQKKLVKSTGHTL